MTTFFIQLVNLLSGHCDYAVSVNVVHPSVCTTSLNRFSIQYGAIGVYDTLVALVSQRHALVPVLQVEHRIPIFFPLVQECQLFRFKALCNKTSFVSISAFKVGPFNLFEECCLTGRWQFIVDVRSLPTQIQQAFGQQRATINGYRSSTNNMFLKHGGEGKYVPLYATMLAARGEAKPVEYVPLDVELFERDVVSNNPVRKVDLDKEVVHIRRCQMCGYRSEMFTVPHKDRDVRVIYTILPQSNFSPLYGIPYITEATVNTPVHGTDIYCIPFKLSSYAINNSAFSHHCCTRL